jgi:endoglucanase
MKRILFAALLSAAAWGPQSASAAESADAIRLNQIGFYPEAPKTAVIADDAASSFFVLSADEGDTLFEGSLGPAKKWTPSDEAVKLADF